VTRRRSSSTAGQKTKFAQLRRELKEAREQQAATSEVLKVISSSPGELQPVFAAMLANATTLCEAGYGAMWLCEGDGFRAAAFHGELPAAYFDQWQVGRLFKLGPESPAVRAAESQKPVQVVDARATDAYRNRDPLYVSAADTAGLRTVIAVPMLKDNKSVGVIVVYRKKVQPFTEKQTELLKNFAAQAVIAIENTRLLMELRESLDRQTATAEVLRTIASAPAEAERALDTIAKVAARLFGASDVNIMRLEGEVLRHVATLGELASAVETTFPNRPLDPSSMPATAILERRPLHIADLSAPDVRARFPAAHLPKKPGSVVAAPLMRKGEAIGAIVLVRDAVRPFTEVELAQVQNFADQAVIAIENARLLDELRRRTKELSQRTDDLTEALDQQTATSEVLKVISSTPGELQPVFDILLENATRLCAAKFGILYLREGDAFRTIAEHNLPSAFAEVRRHNSLLRPSQVSMLGRLLSSRMVVHIRDAAAEQAYLDRDPLFVTAVDIGGFRAAIAVPMFKDGNLVGAIIIMRHEAKPFSDKQIELVENFAAQAVIAIENARLLNELRQRTDDLSEALEQQTATAEILTVISRSPTDVKPVFEIIGESAAKLCDADVSVVSMVDGELIQLASVHGVSAEGVSAVHSAYPMRSDSETITARTVRSADIVHVPDVLADPLYQNKSVARTAGYRACVGVPMIRDGLVIGTIFLARTKAGAFGSTQIYLLKTFADQAVIAIGNVHLFDAVQARTRELAASLEDLRTTQDRLVQTEKLASLGQLTAGIAHEIKNPLNFVNNFSAVSVELIDELRQTLAVGNLDDRLRAEISEIADMLQGNLDKVVQHGRRADSIVKNMLQHSRQGSGEHRPVDINALVEESLNLAYHGARAEKQGFNIILERSLDPTAGEADIFPQDIMRVLLNLITNGFYAATKRKGAASDGYEPTLAATTKNLGDRIEIRIRDNGTGIPREAKEKIFNPFFTTKPAGEGTGLGLSISHDVIVKQHGGSIEVDTQPGEFTEIKVILPRAAASLPERS